MRILFWNVRGLGNPGRRGQLKEVVQINKIEVVAIQETIRESFHMKELERFVGGRDFQWFTKPATGHSGGMLLGANTELFEVVEMDVGQFFISMVLKNKVGGKEWGVINVYGPVQYDRKEDFLREILEKCNSMMVPFLIGEILILLEQQVRNQMPLSTKVGQKSSTIVLLRQSLESYIELEEGLLGLTSKRSLLEKFWIGC